MNNARLLGIVAIFLIASCGEGSAKPADDNPPVFDAGGDSDSDADSDADSDGDADGDTDGDADGDADGDTDGDADTDGDTDADGDTDTDSDSDSDTDAHGDGGIPSECTIAGYACMGEGKCSKEGSLVEPPLECAEEDQVCCDTDGGGDNIVDGGTGVCPEPYGCRSTGWCNSHSGTIHAGYTCPDEEDHICCESDELPTDTDSH